MRAPTSNPPQPPVIGSAPRIPLAPRLVPRIATATTAGPKPLPQLDLKLLAELPSLELQARYLVDGVLHGRHRSRQKGSSVEFAEYRNYQFGDDLRRVDWRLYGRTERLHVRQCEDEMQLRVFVVLDTSASMDFTSRPEAMNKIEFARIMVAGIAALAQRQGDAFGLGLAGTELKDFLRARSSQPHWKSFVGKLDSVQTFGTTNLAASLETLAELIPDRAVIFVASDFYEETPLLQSALQRLNYERHEVIGLHVLDPFELDFDLDKAGVFVDAESNQRVRLDSPAAREGYLKRFRAFCSELDETFHGAGGDIVRLRTDESPVAALTHYLAVRAQRLK